MYDKIKPSKKRVNKNIAALTSLIGMEESSMTKRKFRSKPLVIAAVIAAVSMVSLITVNAANKGAIVKFFMGGEEFQGECYDYVDEEGYRRMSFDAVLPVYEDSYAIIYDVDAPQGENVRVLTEETDPNFMKALSLFREESDKAIEAAHSAWEETGNYDEYLDYPKPKPKDFGITLKYSEICIYNLRSGNSNKYYGGTVGGEFTKPGLAVGKPSGLDIKEHTDFDNGTHTYHHEFYYYVGQEHYVGQEQDLTGDDEDIKGECYDYVDEEGFRRVAFDAVLPDNEDSFAIIYDADAPQGENVRVLTEENDTAFMDALHLYIGEYNKAYEAYNRALAEADKPSKVIFQEPKPEDFGITLKHSELCLYKLKSDVKYSGDAFGGDFLKTGEAAENDLGLDVKKYHDVDNGTNTYYHTFYYYAGKPAQSEAIS